MELAIIIEKFSLITIVLLVSLVVAMYMTLVERRFAAFFQDRLGPNRAGPFGLLQPLADGVKLFTKEEILPTNANKLLFVLGPSLAMFTATITSAVIPWVKTLRLVIEPFLCKLQTLILAYFIFSELFFRCLWNDGWRLGL